MSKRYLAIGLSASGQGRFSKIISEKELDFFRVRGYKIKPLKSVKKKQKLL